MASKTGAGLMGWALFMGVPSTICAFTLDSRLAFALMFATFVAWLIGKGLDSTPGE